MRVQAFPLFAFFIAIVAIGYAQDEHEHEGHGWIGVFSIEEHEEHDGHEDHEDHDEHEDEDHDEHEDEDHEDEDHRRLRNWKGLKEEEEHEEPAHTIQLYKDGEDWAEDSVYVYCVKVSTADFEGLEEGEELFEEYEHHLEEGEVNATIVRNAGELECGANVSIYSLALSEAETFSFIASVHFEEHGSYALKMEHPPEEFMDPTCEGDRCTRPSTMMLRDAEGNYIDPIVSEPSDAPSTDGNQKKWTLPIVASLITALPSLVGILTIPLLFTDKTIPQNLQSQLAACGNSFASGVLLAATVFLMLPEAYQLIAAEAADESEAAGQWGAMICAAFFFSLCFHMLLDIFKSDSVTPEENSTVVDISDLGSREENSTVVDISNSGSVIPGKNLEEATVVETIPSTKTQVPYNCIRSVLNWRPVGYFVAIGDFLHNFVDGFFIAIAFQCSTSLGWQVTFMTIAHELPNEIGDFHVMVTVGRCTFTEAIVTNAIGALSSPIGALIYLGADMSDRMTGMILTFGAAMFLFGATVELPQEFMKEAKTGKQVLYIVSSFAVGCIVMGLVLLDHEHCDAGSIEGGGGGGAHEGHNH